MPIGCIGLSAGSGANALTRDRAFAREFLLASIDEGVPIQLALGKVIRAMGVKEFATKVRMASPNVLRAISPRHNPTQATLNRLLKPFRLKLSLGPVRKQVIIDDVSKSGRWCSSIRHEIHDA